MIKKKGTNQKLNEFLWGWLFILPTMIGLMVLNIIPIFQTIYRSFFKTGDFGRGNIFIGFNNYEKLFRDQEVWQALWNTIKYAITEVPLSIAIALVIAVLLNQRIKGRAVYRTIFFLPMIAAPAAIAMVWRWLYNSKFGLLNHIIGKEISWISDPNIAIFSIAAIGIWSVIGYNMVLFLAGLQEVPRDYYEAAEIDGANKVQQFFRITIPLISPTIFFVCITRVISALQVFDTIFMVMDKTNPALYKTQSLVFVFYKHAFRDDDKGYGAVIVVLLLVVIMFVTIFQTIAQKKWVHYN